MLFYITIEMAWVEFAYHLRTIKTRKKHIRTRHTGFFLILFYTGSSFNIIYVYVVCVFRILYILYLYLRHNNTYHYSGRTLNYYYPMSIRQMLSTGAWARALSLNIAYTYTHTHTHIIIINIIIITYSNIPPKIGIY